MLASFVQGLLLGYGACVPIGPINILLMNLALHSYRSALSTGFGAMSADMLYLTLLSYGLLSLDDSFWMRLLSIFGGLFLCYLAYASWRARHARSSHRHLAPRSLLRHYVQGLTLTALNPYTVGFWSSVSLLAHSSQDDYLYLFAGMALAIGSWITLMPLAIYRSRHLIGDSVLLVLSLVSAVVLAGFGAMLLWRGFEGFWGS